MDLLEQEKHYSKKIAKLDFIYVDTGAMYRALALYFIRNKISSNDKEQIEKACDRVDVTIEYKDGEQQVLLNGENMSVLFVLKK